MKRKYSALALSAVALGAVALTTTESSAMGKDPGSEPASQSAPLTTPGWPDEGTGFPGSDSKTPEYIYPNYDPKYEVAQAPVQAATSQSRSDDNGVEALQAGASALGGAAVAFGGMWLLRRRHVLAG
jgi:hypothetical protein